MANRVIKLTVQCQYWRPLSKKKSTEGQGQANPNPNFLLLRLVCDCVQEKPMYYMRLCYRETHVCLPLYMTVRKIKLRTGVKFFKNKENLSMTSKHHYKSEPRQDMSHWIKAKTGYWSTELTQNSLGSPVESPVLLFRNKHPYNWGSGVTNVLLKLADNQL